MSYDILWSELALDQLQEAYDYLEGVESGLGDELMDSVEQLQDIIRERPLLYRVVAQRARRALTQRFSYAVFYWFEDETIYIAAFLHTSRSSEQWPA